MLNLSIGLLAPRLAPAKRAGAQRLFAVARLGNAGPVWLFPELGVKGICPGRLDSTRLTHASTTGHSALRRRKETNGESCNRLFWLPDAASPENRHSAGRLDGLSGASEKHSPPSWAHSPGTQSAIDCSRFRWPQFLTRFENEDRHLLSPRRFRRDRRAYP